MLRKNKCNLTAKIIYIPMLGLKDKKNIQFNNNFKLNCLDTYESDIKFIKHLVIEGKDENGDVIYFINTHNPRILYLKKDPDFFFFKESIFDRKASYLLVTENINLKFLKSYDYDHEILKIKNTVKCFILLSEFYKKNNFLFLHNNIEHIQFGEDYLDLKLKKCVLNDTQKNLFIKTFNEQKFEKFNFKKSLKIDKVCYNILNHFEEEIKNNNEYLNEYNLSKNLTPEELLYSIRKNTITI